VGLVAILIKSTSRGPVFVRQERIGLNRRVYDRRRNGGHPRGAERRGRMDRRANGHYGKPFRMYKFRSMREGAEIGQPVWAVEDDPRITGVGRVLRRTRIDEIPQFLNVLRGDMSVVGPRPERQYFYGELERDVPDFPMRLRAKPGITGLAQVSNGYSNTIAGARVKLGHDLNYIRNLTPSTDARILVKTISVVLTGKGAF
jgi:lipopolysaccharide/colanic/teichoic acid biosynthesis glycosyltransferase